jgi:cyclic pyranopterin phosphate synthase
MLDQFNRKIDYLRISVTDKCNFRCAYCMPEKGVKTLKHDDILNFDEIVRICKSAVKLGIHKIKITGGEPLVRKGIVNLIQMINEIEGIEEITMTTNGYLLADYLTALKKAGIAGINISLDTLKDELFYKITRRNGLSRVIHSIKDAVKLGIPVKINCVPIEENRGELAEIAALARDYPVHVRFIEMMPIGFGQLFDGIYQDDIIKKLEEAYGNMTLCTARLGNGPAKYYKIEGFQGKIGFISAMSHEFCGDCNRIRITADGCFKLCLNYDSQINIRDYIRTGVSDEELEVFMKHAIFNKPQRHGFLENDNQEKEMRKMVGIGG